jgi:hypothetical protein
MAGRNVNQFITNWQWTGQDVPTPQATVDITLEWMDENGQAQNWSGTATFPNDLQFLPVAWVRDAMEDLMIRAVRKQLDIDD